MKSQLTKNQKCHVFEVNRVKTSRQDFKFGQSSNINPIDESVVIPNYRIDRRANLRLHKRDFNEIRHRRDVVPFN